MSHPENEMKTIKVLVINKERVLTAKDEMGNLVLPTVKTEDHGISISALKENLQLITGMLLPINYSIKIDYDADVDTFGTSVSAPLGADFPDIEGFEWMDIDDYKRLPHEITYALTRLCGVCLYQNPKESWVKIVWYLYCDSGKRREKYLREIKSRDDENKLPPSFWLTGILLSLTSAFVFDRFFAFHIPGISVVIFSIVFLISGIITLRGKLKIFRPFPLILLAAVLALSINYAIFNNDMLIALNFFALPICSCGFFFTARYDEKGRLINIIRGILHKLFFDSFRTVPVGIHFIEKSVSSKKDNKSIARGVLFGLLIGLPIIIVVLMLLSSADTMFSYYMSQLNIGSIMGHLLLTLMIATFLFSLFWCYRYEGRADAFEVNVKRNWQVATAVTILFLLSIVYLLFSIIQFRYLYANGANHLPDGFSFTAYVHHGFGELNVVAVINILIIGMFKMMVTPNSKNAKITLNTFLSLMVLFTVNMLVSSMWRMYLYQDSTGYTPLRLYVDIYMVFVLVALVFIMVWIWSKGFSVASMIASTAVIFYIALNLANINGSVAYLNIERYKDHNQKADLVYLNSLSYDAINELKDNNVYEKSMWQDSFGNRKNWFEWNYYYADAKKIVEGK